MARVRRHGRGVRVYTPRDFLDLGTRGAVDMALSRLAKSGTLRKVRRGMYDWPYFSDVLGRSAPASTDAVVAAVQRRTDANIGPDNLVAANAFGLTNAVPTRPTFIASRTLGGAQLAIGNRRLQFRAAGSKLAPWLKSDAKPIVQALFWARKQRVLDDDVVDRIARAASPEAKMALAKDLIKLPAWAHAPARRIAGIVPSDR
jgi:hypothetical protein